MNATSSSPSLTTAPAPGIPRGKHRVLIIDDHPVLRQGLSVLLNQEPDLMVCGQAATAAQGFQSVQSLRPDVVIVDLTLRGANGMELTKNIKAVMPELPVVVLSMHDENHFAERCLRAGASAYVMKQEATDQLFTAIRRALAGEVHVSDAISKRIVHRLIGKRRAPEDSAQTLSDRELEVLQSIGSGQSTREIAEGLKVSVKTVETYRAKLKVKLNLADRQALLRYAVNWVSAARFSGAVPSPEEV